MFLAFFIENLVVFLVMILNRIFLNIAYSGQPFKSDYY